VDGHLTLESNLISAQWLCRRYWYRFSILISPTATPSTATTTTAATSLPPSISAPTFSPIVLVGRSDIEAGDVYKSRISASGLTTMFAELMRLQVHVCVEDDKLLLQALTIIA
jgi:hypothetical protein